MTNSHAIADERFWALLGVVEELVDVALALDAPYLCAHVPTGRDSMVVIAYDRGRVWLNGEDVEVELLRC